MPVATRPTTRSLSCALGALLLGLAAWSTERLGTPHPPALATTLVASLGMLRDWTDAAALLGGALAIACWRAATAGGGRGAVSRGEPA